MGEVRSDRLIKRNGQTVDNEYLMIYNTIRYLFRIRRLYMQRRNTVQKEFVMNAVLSLRSHATADEVYHFIEAEHPNVSKTTVYRNLNLLAEEGFIRKIQIPGEADCFDHLTHDHYHVRCLKCGKVFDVDMQVVSDLESRINDKQGFVFLGCDVVFKGICPKCKIEHETAKAPDAKKKSE